MRLSFLLAAGALAAFRFFSPVAAQPLPASPVVFDDFAYADSVFSASTSAPSSGRLFAPVAWCSGTPAAPCADTTTTRLWYHAFWVDFENQYGGTDIVADTSALHFVARAGTVRGSGRREPQIASGLTATRGVWAARVRLDDILALREQGQRSIQAFWLYSPYHARLDAEARDDGRSRAWSEVDFEFQNFFGRPTDWFGEKRDDPGVYMSTGSTEDDGTHPWPLTAAFPEPPSEPYAATLVLADGTSRILSPEAVGQFLSGRYRPSDDAPAIRPGWIDLAFHINDQGIRYAVEAEGPWGRFASWSPVYSGPLPSQPLMTMFTQYVWSEGDRPHAEAEAVPFQLARDLRFSADWFYYAPQPWHSLARIRENVAAFRARGMERVNTTGQVLTAPLVPCPEPRQCGWSGLTYARPGFALALTGPDTLQAAEAEAAEWIAVPPARPTHYILTWRWRTHTADGPGTWTVLSEASFRFRTPPLSRRATALEIEVEAVDRNPLYEGGPPFETQGRARRLVPIAR